MHTTDEARKLYEIITTLMKEKYDEYQLIKYNVNNIAKFANKDKAIIIEKNENKLNELISICDEVLVAVLYTEICAVKNVSVNEIKLIYTYDELDEETNDYTLIINQDKQEVIIDLPVLNKIHNISYTKQYNYPTDVMSLIENAQQKDVLMELALELIENDKGKQWVLNKRFQNLGSELEINIANNNKLKI